MTHRSALPAVLLTAVISVFLCPAEAVKIYPEYVLDAPENSTIGVYCSYSQGLHPVSWTWTLITKTNKTLSLAACSSKARTCTTAHTDITVQRHFSPYSSIIYFNKIQRDKDGVVVCSGTYANDSIFSDQRRLNIYKLPVMESCSVDTVRRNWSVVLSCEVSRVFSTADLYTSEVKELYDHDQLKPTNERHNLFYYFQMFSQLKRNQLNPLEETRSVMWVFDTFTGSPGNASDSFAMVLHGKKSYHQALSSYINRTDYKAYYRGKVVRSWGVESFPAADWTITIKVCSGYESRTCVESNINMSVSKPSAPSHNCADLHYLPETGGTQCLCTADHLGSPEGRLMWVRGDVAMVTGEYGVHQLLLPADVVTRQMDGQQVACQLDWIKPQRAALPVNVAYGPDRVDLRVYVQHEAGDQLLILVECQVTGLNPRSLDMVQWEGPCQGQAGFTCTLDPKDREVQGKTVKCRVTNTHNNGHSAQAADIIQTGKAADSNSSDHMKWAAIGAAAMLVVVAVIIALVFLTVWACRHGRSCRSGPVYDSTKHNRTQQSDNSSADTHLYEVMINNQNTDRTLPPVPNPDQTYENQGCFDREAHM